jgi:tRNA 2-thiouridine synthesizing protein A
MNYLKKSDYTLDCRGLSCPMPLLKTYKTLATMTSGDILELWGTDPGTKNDIEMAMTNAGNEYLGFKDDEGITRYFIKKG